MESSLLVLLGTALTIGTVHTAVGPDHYLPFIVLARSEGWTLRRTLLWTGLCGLGHVLSSIIVGGLGIAVGWSLTGMEWFEGSRGDLAAYMLLAFGAVYMIYGIYRSRRGHAHRHVHGDGSVHTHHHDHDPAEHSKEEHAETEHEEDEHVKAHRRTLWALFLVFVLGPCEPLIPLLMVPAAEHSALGTALVAGLFGLATTATMLIIVTAGYFGLKLVNLGPLERHVHTMSGAAIFASGAAIAFLGL